MGGALRPSAWAALPLYLHWVHIGSGSKQNITVLAACCAAVLLAQPSRTSSPSVAFADAPKTHSFRIATWNAFLLPSFLEGRLTGESDPVCRASEAGRYLADFSPKLDVVGLQEAFDPGLFKIMSQGAAPALPALEGPRPNECEREGSCKVQTGGLALLSNAQARMGKSFAKGYAGCQGADCLANKGFLFAPIYFPDSSEVALNVVITHLQAARGKVPVEQIQRAQLGELRAFLEARTCKTGAPPVPLVLIGDLNTAFFPTSTETKDNDIYEQARAELRLSCLGDAQDVFRTNIIKAVESGSKRGTKNCSGGLLPAPCRRPADERRLDHIWYWSKPGALEVERVAIDDGLTKKCRTEYLSDHRLVWAQFRLSR